MFRVFVVLFLIFVLVIPVFAQDVPIPTTDPPTGPVVVLDDATVGDDVILPPENAVNFLFNLVGLVPMIGFATPLTVGITQLIKQYNTQLHPSRKWNYKLVTMVVNCVIALLLWIFTALGQEAQFTNIITQAGGVAEVVSLFMMNIAGGTLASMWSYEKLKAQAFPTMGGQSALLNEPQIMEVAA